MPLSHGAHLLQKRPPMRLSLWLTPHCRTHLPPPVTLHPLWLPYLNTAERGYSIPVSTRHARPTPQIEEYDNNSASNSPSSRSPLKHRAKLDGDHAAPPRALKEQDCTLRQPNNMLDCFPTSNQAVSKQFLKEMMLALRSAIQQSFTEALNKQTSLLDDMGERVNHVQNKMEEFWQT